MMKYRKLMMKHILAWALSVTMLFSSVSVPVLAEGAPSAEEEVQENENPEEKPVVVDDGQAQTETRVETAVEADDVNSEQGESGTDKPENPGEDGSAGQQPVTGEPQVTEGGTESGQNQQETSEKSTSGNDAGTGSEQPETSEEEASGDAASEESEQQPGTTEKTEQPAAEAQPETQEAAIAPQAAVESGTAVVLQEEPVEEELQTETIELDSELLADLPDNDKLFAGYVQKILYGDDGIATYGTVARDNLSEGQERDLYDELKAKITAVAAKGGGTSFSLNGSYDYDPDNNNTAWVNDVLRALILDCPYELYWYGNEVWKRYDSNKKKLTSVELIVAKAYQGGSYNIVDGTKAETATNAAANAKAIVEKHKDELPHERLQSYRQEICDLVAYDKSVGKNTDYGDPWQLIYVFDKDSTTNVVGEGYAKAFQYLCDLDGEITCYTVTGTMGWKNLNNSADSGSDSHMWNIVTLRGKNYLVDVTNCDGDTTYKGVGYPNLLFLAGVAGSYKNYQKTITTQSNSKYTITYTYDSGTLSVYSEEELTLAATDYVYTEPVAITEDMVNFDDGTVITGFTYDAKSRNVVVKNGETTLSPGTDYTLTITKDGEEFSGAIRNAGTYEIVVTGEEGYTGSVEKTVTIEKKPVTLSIEGTATKQYDGNTGAPGVRVTIDGQCNGDPLGSVTTCAYDTPDVGENKRVTVSVTLEGENAGNYNLAESTVTMDNGVITKGDPTIKFRELAGAYATTYTYSGEALRNPEGNELILANITTGVQIISYEDLHFTWFKGTVGSGTELDSAPVDAGEYYVVVSVNEAANYHAASCSSGQIIIQPKTVQNPEIILSQDSYKYDGTEKTPTVTVKDEDTIIPSTEYTVSYSDNKNAGTATVTISSKPGGNYVVSGSKNFTITKVDSAELTTEELTVSGVYGTETDKLAVTGGKVTTTDGKEIAGTWTVTDTASHDMEKLLTVVETETCTLTFTPEDTNYPQLTKEVTPAITKRPAKVTVNPVSRKYKEADPEFTYMVVTEEGYPALVGNDDPGINLATTATEKSSVGTYDITGTASNPNYDVTITGGENALTITKAAAPQPVTEVRSYIYASVPTYCVNVYWDTMMNLPADCGKVNYGREKLSGDTSILTRAAVYNSWFEYCLRDGLTADKIGAEAVVKVPVQMENYEDTYYELTIKIVDKKDITGSASAKNSITYGQKLSDVELEGTFTDAENKDTILKGTFTIKNPDVQPNAGSTEVEWIFTPADKNYKPVNGTTDITVEKATPESAAAPTAAGLTYGQTLAESMLTGGAATNPNTHEAVRGTWSWADGTVIPTVDNQGYRVVFTPDDTADYKSIEVTVEVTVKKAVPAISEAPTAAGITYGQTLSESTLTGGNASVDGTFTWVKADTRPEVKDSNVTEYEVVFAPADSVNWETVTATVKVEVSKKVLTWDGSALTVLTKLADETKDASLIGELKVSGLLDGDDAGLSYERLIAEFDTAEAGTDRQVTVTIVGAALKNENYQLPDETTCILKGSIEKTEAAPVQPDADSGYRLVISEKDKAEVTVDLAKNENLNTPEKIVEYLKKILLERKTDGKTPEKENTVVYDAVLLYSTDGGVTWTRATADNFPEDGIKVTLSYPDGTNASDYRFSAAHMFTMNRTDSNGTAYRAGDVETPELTLTQNGITMTLKSLSPIALSWVKVEKTPDNGNNSGNTDSDTGKDTESNTGSDTGKGTDSTVSNDNGNNTDSSTSTANKKKGHKHHSSSVSENNSVNTSVESTESAVQSAVTGDSSQPVWWGTLTVLCLAGIWIMMTAARRKKK